MVPRIQGGIDGRIGVFVVVVVVIVIAVVRWCYLRAGSGQVAKLLT